MHPWNSRRHLRLAAALLVAAPLLALPQSRPRARDLGIAPGSGTPGPLNAITDVKGVRVGHATLVEGNTVRTGVTAIVPHAGNVFRDKVPGAVFVGNAFGKLAGSTQVEELGTIEAPIVLTNTLSVGVALDAIVRWTMTQPGNEQVRSVNGVVGETNDGTLNDIRGLHVTREHVLNAINYAQVGPVDEGAVGAGTGTIAFGWKGGIGTSSRFVRQGTDLWTVGVLVQTNYGGKLVIDGVPVWREISPTAALSVAVAHPPSLQASTPSSSSIAALGAPPPSARAAALEDSLSSPGPSTDGSCMIVIATDAPLDARDLKRLAARGVFALGRTGSTYSNGSGDFAIAFSTHSANRLTATNGPQPRLALPTDALSGLFEAALDATEEAVYNSLLKATDVTANGRTIRALPVDALKAAMTKYGR